MNNEAPNMNQAPVAPGPGPGDNKARTGMILGIVSIVLSIVADCLALAPIVGLILSVIALACGIVGIVMAVKGGNMNAAAGLPKGGMSTAGIVCGIIGVVFSGIAVACTGCWACAVCTVKNAGEAAVKQWAAEISRSLS